MSSSAPVVSSTKSDPSDSLTQEWKRYATDVPCVQYNHGSRLYALATGQASHDGQDDEMDAVFYRRETVIALLPPVLLFEEGEYKFLDTMLRALPPPSSDANVYSRSSVTLRWCVPASNRVETFHVDKGAVVAALLAYNRTVLAPWVATASIDMTAVVPSCLIPFYSILLTSSVLASKRAGPGSITTACRSPR